jgi:hypothetical protein
VVNVRRGADPDLIIRYPDGTHAAIAMSSTDYALSRAPEPQVGCSYLLDLLGLYQVACLITRFRHEDRSQASHGNEPR